MVIKHFEPLFFSKNPAQICNVASGFFSFCTKTLSSSLDTIHQRILPAGDPKISIVPILDQWVQEGRPLNQSELKYLVNLLRKYKRYTHALQLAEWMSDKRLSNLSPGDIAVRLDLISKACGLPEAEKYFSKISDDSKTLKVYGSLLNCYANKRLLGKAEETMQKMRDLGYDNTLSYNVMLNLYSKLGKREKLEKLVQEMREKGISLTRPTFYILLNAYAACSDIEAMERVLQEMENDLLVTLDWHVYVIVAKGYLKLGLEDKTSEMLKEAEKLFKVKRRGNAYDILLSMYATLGNNNEVSRIWNVYKKKGNISNMGYFHMITSLIRLDDIDGAEKILEEWESVNKSYDWRIPNALINAYTKKGLMSKAEAVISRAVESEKKVPASTWDHLATGYRKDYQMDKAVGAMKRAIFACHGTGWILNHDTVKACLKHLKKEGGAEKEEFERLLGERGISPEKITGLHENGSSEDFSDELEGNNEELPMSLGSKDVSNI